MVNNVINEWCRIIGDKVVIDIPNNCHECPFYSDSRMNECKLDDWNKIDWDMNDIGDEPAEGCPIEEHRQGSFT